MPQRGMSWAAPALAWLCVSSVQAADWPHWRGPHRNDLVEEPSGWRDGDWPLEQLWIAELDEGSSSPVIAGGHFYGLGWKNGRNTLRCLDAVTGESQWDVSYETPQYGRQARGDEGLYSGPCSTPEYDEQTGYLYTLSLDGDIHCWDTNDRGRNVWKKNLYEDYDVPVRPRVGRSGHRDYGYTSSPLVQADQLIVEVGAPAGNLMAFDKRTGGPIWTSVDRSPAGHNGGPVPVVVESVPCVAVHNFEGLLVVRIDEGHEGETVATAAWRTDFGNNVATAAVFDNSVIITSSYNHEQLARFRITLAGGAEKVWEIDHASKVCSPLIFEGNVYWAWSTMYCVDFETGALRWQGGETSDAGSLVATSDKRLIRWSGSGDLALIDSAARSPDEYRELTSRKVMNRTDAWPHVVLANGHLYCKDRFGQVICFRVP